MESTLAPPKASARLRRLSGFDGLRLQADHYGDPAAPRVLYTHGFGQNRRAWAGTAQTLAEQGWGGLAIDARGHGDSAWLPSGEYELEQFVADLHHLCAELSEPPVLIGASMGGLVALLAQGEKNRAVHERPLFRALVLVDVTPRWERSGVDRILSFMAAHPEGFASLEAANAAVAAYLPHREGKDPERLRSQLRRGEDGRWRWHWDPRLLGPVANSAERYIPRLQAAAQRIDIPTLLLSGSLSDVVSDHTIAEFRDLVPHAEHVVVDQATHLIVGDRNDVFSNAILAWLECRFGPAAGVKPPPGVNRDAPSTGVAP
jgi:pimeloyl-ACP methyl ester carboxylesterase